VNREIIAILRGVEPAEIGAIGQALVEAGVDQIEVPLNSPTPFRSIETLAKNLTGKARIGAGTVLSAEEVDRVRDSGGTLIVSPDCNPSIIERTKTLNIVSYPGVASPTECFTALRHGAGRAEVLSHLLGWLQGTGGHSGRSSERHTHLRRGRCRPGKLQRVVYGGRDRLRHW
jgi:2-dehydro-3-deoxyphosphogalactonate aldolase